MATKAYYQHHQRTTDAALISDLQSRELGYSSESDYAIIKNNAGTARYIPTFSTTAIIESSSDIGIGISPSHPLDVYRASTNNIAKFKHAGSGGTIIVADGTADFYIGSQSGNGFLGGSTTGTAKVNINLTSGDMTVAGSIQSGFKIGAGRTPITLLDIYHLTADSVGTFETNKVNGLAYNIFTNDATSWSAGVNASDEYIIVHSAGLVSNPALTIDTSEIITFANFPITPSSAPTTDYQVANRKYVDDTVGNVSKVGTPVNDQIAVWTGDGTIEGTSTLQYSSAGFLGIGARTPITQLDVYNATNDVACTLETDKTNGLAYNVFTNDVNSWSSGIDANNFVIRNTTDLSSPLFTLTHTGAMIVYNATNDVVSTLETNKTNGQAYHMYINKVNSFAVGVNASNDFVIVNEYWIGEPARLTIDGTTGDLTLAEDLIMAAGKSITMGNTVIYELVDNITMDLLCTASFTITGENDRDVLICGGPTRNVTISNDVDLGGAVIYGNVGIDNASLENWDSTLSVIQIGGSGVLRSTKTPAASNSVILAQNEYYDGADNKYIVTDEAGKYSQSGGRHIFQVAPSGTADTVISYITALTIQNDGSVDTLKAKITPEGGYAIKLTNRSGGALTKGRVVECDSANDDSFTTAAAGTDHPIGVVYDTSIADDAEGWIVISGIADVLLEDNVASTRDWWMGASTTEAGYAETSAASPGFTQGHFDEIGHCIQSVAATGGGTHILARCVLHFN